ncbi:MAG: dockerin type I domain-containing protein [Blastocatellia bacterium]|nr:dockerin type I domain-containing protein [Blastocatellia bacterium]MCS7156661.1 dockerin type I domain-containing protein [Blastocatellia bacterium]MCX7751597.1 dockerin type I domain-containing protein [Blastocatellia bacterium]MDW8168697.1 choice-of-anchor V domain-containing protein [Acidobacteriota bacterium]MDW8256963.1 choice-of-anchor V domain-containing protein [Acidobacteriota bacterium]
MSESWGFRCRRFPAFVTYLLGLVFGFLATGLMAFGLSTGPPPGFTQAPGESTCTECHDSFGEATNRGPGELVIEHPPRYELGQVVTVVVKLEHAGQRRWGFQLTALTADTSEPAGELLVIDPLHTRRVEGPNGRPYIGHTREGTFAGHRDRAQWVVAWRAPERDLGPVTFYATGNAADGDGTRLGDWIYAAESTIVPPSYPTATLRFPRGGETFRPGQPVVIHWEASSNVTSFDVLFFPRAGALPMTIASGLPAEARSLLWIVPDLQTESARLAVLAFNDVGFALADSKPFRIVTAPHGQPGDVNGDGRLDERDLQLLLRILSGKTPPIPMADVNGDGAINFQDALRLLELLLRQRVG